ncbi:hypothetical protein DRQ11_11195, partial [candidate division KSB1 bacterium]
DGLSIRLTAILNTYLLNLPGKLQRLLNTTIQKFLFTAQRPSLLTNALGIGLGGGFNFLWGKWWLLKQNQAASSPAVNDGLSVKVSNYIKPILIFTGIVALPFIFAFLTKDSIGPTHINIYQEELKLLLERVWGPFSSEILDKVTYTIAPLDWWHLIRYSFISSIKWAIATFKAFIIPTYIVAILIAALFHIISVRKKVKAGRDLRNSLKSTLPALYNKLAVLFGLMVAIPIFLIPLAEKGTMGMVLHQEKRVLMRLQHLEEFRRTAAHEATHVIQEQLFIDIKEENPLATAVERIRKLELMGESSLNFFEKIEIDAGKKAVRDYLFGEEEERIKAKKYLEMLNILAKKGPSEIPPILLRIPYISGGHLAGVALEISQQTEDPDRAWKFIGLMLRGKDIFEAIEKSLNSSDVDWNPNKAQEDVVKGVKSSFNSQDQANSPLEKATSSPITQLEEDLSGAGSPFSLTERGLSHRLYNLIEVVEERFIAGKEPAKTASTSSISTCEVGKLFKEASSSTTKNIDVNVIKLKIENPQTPTSSISETPSSSVILPQVSTEIMPQASPSASPIDNNLPASERNKTSRQITSSGIREDVNLCLRRKIVRLLTVIEKLKKKEEALKKRYLTSPTLTFKEKQSFNPDDLQHLKNAYENIENLEKDIQLADKSSQSRRLNIARELKHLVKPSEELKGYIDLHVHTFMSDGQYSPTYVVYDAWRKGLKAVAVVDHNTFEHFEEAIEAGKIFGITVIPAVEFDVTFEYEVESQRYEAEYAHLIGYFSPKEELDLKEWLNNIKDSQLYQQTKSRVLWNNIKQEISRQRFNESQRAKEENLKITFKDYWIELSGLGHPNWTQLGKVLIDKYPQFKGKKILDVAKEYGHGIRGGIQNPVKTDGKKVLLPDAIKIGRYLSRDDKVNFGQDLRFVLKELAKLGALPILAHPIEERNIGYENRVKKIGNLKKYYKSNIKKFNDLSENEKEKTLAIAYSHIKAILKAYPQVRGLEVYSSKHTPQMVDVFMRLIEEFKKEGISLIVTLGSDTHYNTYEEGPLYLGRGKNNNLVPYQAKAKEMMRQFEKALKDLKTSSDEIKREITSSPFVFSKQNSNLLNRIASSSAIHKEKKIARKLWNKLEERERKLIWQYLVILPQAMKGELKSPFPISAEFRRFMEKFEELLGKIAEEENISQETLRQELAKLAESEYGKRWFRLISPSPSTSSPFADNDKREHKSFILTGEVGRLFRKLFNKVVRAIVNVFVSYNKEMT